MVLNSQYSLGRKVPNKDLPAVLFEHMLRHRNRLYLADSVTGKEYTYEQAHDCCHQIGQSLYRDHGLRKGDVVLIFSPNCPEYGLITIGAAAVGLVVSFANPLYTEGELGYHVNDCEAKLIVTTEAQAGKVQSVARTCTSVQNVIVFGNAPDCLPFSSLLSNDGTNFPRVAMDPKNDVIFMPYSSGTTGRPKGVMLTHWNVLNNSLQIIAPKVGIFTEGRHEILVCFVPLYHVYGLQMILTTALCGHSLVLIPRYELNSYLRCVKRYKATILPIVPPTVVQFTKNADIVPSHFESAHKFIYGAAPVKAEIEDEFKKKFPKQKISQGYGLTETSTVVTLVPTHLPLRMGSVGQVLPNTQLKFVDPDTGKEVFENVDAEIWARGPQIMKGYYKRPADTREMLVADGWLRTGDIGHYDSDGFVYIVDRLKELIKFKGLQVAPAELEGLLFGHSSVADCAVVGVPDLEAGELPRAYIVLKPGHHATEHDVKRFLDGHVAPHKKLRGGVRFVDAIPKSPSGKILRRVLKDQIKAELKLPSKL